MKEEIKDFTSMYSHEKAARQSVIVQEDIAKLLALLNTHRMITEGGVDLYIEKGGFESIDLTDVTGYKIPDNKDLARFMALTIANMAHEARNEGDKIVAVANKLKEFDPENQESAKALEKAWQDESELIEEMLYLYSEYLYKVFLDNPYKVNLVGLKTH